MTYLEAVTLLAFNHPIACLVTKSAPELRIVFANAAFTRMTGYSLFELEGHSPRLLQGKATEAIMVKRFRDAIGEEKSIRGVITNYRKGKERYLCEIALSPVRDEQGSVSHFLAFEREVLRKRGRPAAGDRRYQPAHEEQSGFRELFDAGTWSTGTSLFPANGV